MTRYVRAALAGALLAAAPAAAENGPSLEGFSGQLTTPSAWAQTPGTAQLLFTNAPRVESMTTSTFVASFGFLRYVELAGRITDISFPEGPRDLSFNAKLQLPLDLLAPRLPLALAVGTQDEGGESAYFQTRYAVASARLGPATISAGWGSGPDRMEGVFAGGALRLLAGVEALAEWDTENVNAGARLSIPLDRIGLPLRIGGIAMTALDRQPRTVEWGATLEVPLWLNASAAGRTAVPVKSRRGSGAASSSAAPPAQRATPAAPSDAPATPSPATVAPVEAAIASGAAPSTPALGHGAVEEDADDDALRRLEGSLVDIGFEEVRVGLEGETLVVEYENTVFNHAEADGLQVVAREIALAGLADRDLAIVLKQNGLRLAELETPANAGPRSDVGWKLAPAPRRATWVSDRPRNRKTLHTALVLAPALRTFLATPAGVLDYVVSFRPDVIVPFWPGATGFVRFDVPLVWSDDLREGGAFREYHDDPHVEYALLHQAFPLARGLWGMVGGGVFRSIDAGGLGELLWAPGDGALALGAQGSWTVNDAGDERKGLTGSVRLAIAPLDLVATVRAGRFVNGDESATVQLARWFGDTQLGVYFTSSDPSVAGAFLSIPLTPRRDMRPRLIQVRGRRFGYDVGTVVGEERNFIRTDLGIAPMSPWNLEAAYLDEARVTRAGLEGALRH